MSERIEIMGCLIDNLTMEETLQTIEKFIHSGKPHQHVVVNVDKLVKAHHDPKLRRIINECDLINVDGMPVVWASRLLGKPLKERVTGVDLFERLMERAAEKGWRIYFLGAREEIVKGLTEKLAMEYPQIQIAGYRNGYWKPEDIGLEWFYRFWQEPGRMFKRYFIDDTYFLWLLAEEFIKMHRSRRD